MLIHRWFCHCEKAGSIWRLFIVELDGITDSITLDTPLMEAYQGVTSVNSCMSGDFPTLLPGSNAISWMGNVTKVVIQPNWRYL